MNQITKINQFFKKSVVFVKKHPYFSFLAFLIGGSLILSLTFNFLSPTNPSTSEPETSSTKLMKQITPGEKIPESIKAKLPVTKTSKEDGWTVLNLKSDFSAKDNLIILGQDNEVIFTKTHYTYNETHTVEKYVKEYGQPDLILEAPQISSAVKAYVFLNHGILIIAHKQDGSVEQVWRFKPTTKELFLVSWGKELKPEGTLPEPDFLNY